MDFDSVIHQIKSTLWIQKDFLIQVRGARKKTMLRNLNVNFQSIFKKKILNYDSIRVMIASEKAFV